MVLHENSSEALISHQHDQELYLKYYQLVCSASIVILMQLGFTFLEVGSVRVQFTKSILMKNIVDMMLSALMYFAIGFGFAFGDGSSTGGFIGVSNFFLEANESDYSLDHSPAGWIYHWSYCATAATIVAGAIAERTQLVAYGVYSVVGATVLYPVITHWVWSATGWASANNSNRLIMGVLDDAGGICVHTCAGMCSLVTCLFVGPRQNRLDRHGNFVKELPKQNQAFIVFGMFILWFSWYAFNAGPAILAAGDNVVLMGKIAVFTTVCAASSGTMYLFLSVVFRKKLPEPCDMCNGILAGLVCSTSGCSVIEPYWGIVIGSVGGIVVLLSSKLLLKLKVDDVVDATAVHLGCGTWSALSAPIFASRIYRRNSMGVEELLTCGIITGCSEGWTQLGSNFLLTLLTIVWVAIVISPVCILLKECRILRVRVESEIKGVDMVEFEGLAYNSDMKQSRGNTDQRYSLNSITESC